VWKITPDRITYVKEKYTQEVLEVHLSYILCLIKFFMLICIVKFLKPTINYATYVKISDIHTRHKDLLVIHAAIYYRRGSRRKRRWHSCTLRLDLLRYKGYIWRGNKQIDIVKRFYGTWAPMLGPRLRPSLNGVNMPRVRTHSNWFSDRLWFQGRLNCLHLTLHWIKWPSFLYNRTVT